MSGERGVAATLLWLLVLWNFAGEASARAGDDRTAQPARQTAPQTAPLRQSRGAPLREPRAVHERLQTICGDAGFGRRDYRACAQSITRACGRAGLRPDTSRCWQWLVDRDSGGRLDRRSLKAAPGRKSGRN